MFIIASLEGIVSSIWMAFPVMIAIILNYIWVVSDAERGVQFGAKYYYNRRRSGFLLLAGGAVVGWLGWNVKWSGWFLWSALTSLFLAGPLIWFGAWHVIGGLGHRDWAIKVKNLDEDVSSVFFFHVLGGLLLFGTNYLIS